MSSDICRSCLRRSAAALSRDLQQVSEEICGSSGKGAAADPAARYQPGFCPKFGFNTKSVAGIG